MVDVIVWVVIIGIFMFPVVVTALIVSAVRNLKREKQARIAEAQAEQEYLASLTHEQRMEYLALSARDSQLEATRRAGLGIAAVIAFGGMIDNE